MAVTIEQLETIERDWVLCMREFDLTDEQIAINLGYTLIQD